MLKLDALTEKAARTLLCMQRHSWEHGTAMQAFYELGYTDIVNCMAREAAYRAMPDGRPASVGYPVGVIDGITDPCSVGEALEAAAQATGDALLVQGAEKLRVWALEKAPRNPEGVLYHLNTGRQFWADSLYMLPPYLAAIGEYDQALHNLYAYWNALRDATTGLLCHIWDDGAGQMEDANHWGTGQGWALAGLARVIALLPEEYAADRQRLAAMSKSLLDAVLPYRDADGAFHDVVDDPATFREVNLCQMIAYAIYRGIADGWLDASYLTAAEEVRAAARAEIDEFGFIHHVCGAPTFDRSGFSPEGQAFCLLAEAARAKIPLAQATTL